MASDIWLLTILIVRKETRCRHIGYSYRLTARVLLYAPSHRQDNIYHGLCYTSRGALAGTRNSSMCPPADDLAMAPLGPVVYLYWTYTQLRLSKQFWTNKHLTGSALYPDSKCQEQVMVKFLFFLVFNVHIQSKLLWYTPVMGTHSSYQLGCLSRTDG